MIMTKGMKSSEFWMTLLFSIITILCNIILQDKCPLPEVTIPGLIGAYALSRGLAKRGE